MRSSKRTLSAMGIGILMVVLGSCDKSDPTASADATIVVTASPSTVRFTSASTATSRIDATVLDKDGRPVPGVAARFSTNSGSLRSNGTPIRTDANGLASDVLTLAVNDDDATVTARSGNKEKTVTVMVGAENQRPVAKITVTPIRAKVGQTVSFDGTTSTDADGNQTISSWHWTLISALPDGSSSTDTSHTEESFPKAFSSPRTVTVLLKVTDDQGLDSLTATASAPLVVVANFGRPSAVLSPSSSFTGSVGIPINLSGAASRDDPLDIGGTIVRYDWNMGDGSGEVSTTTPSFTYTYLSAGTYTIRLTVWDNGDGANCLPAPSYLCEGSDFGTTSVVVTVNP